MANSTKLKYKLTHDVLFKLLFTKYQHLLKHLVAELLGIALGSIKEFIVTNSEITPEELGKKFCRLDINMTVNGQIVDLEVQVSDEKNYPERSLYYWAREFSTALNENENYALLPRTIVISILGFIQFANPHKYHSEFMCLETASHEPLTDKMVLHFFELKKLPPLDGTESGRDLWLKLFKAKTEKDLAKIERMGVPVMNEAIGAYRHVAASDEMARLERMRSKAGHDEAQALSNAERKGERKGRAAGRAERKKLQSALADKDAALAEQAALIAELRKQLGG